VNVTFLPAAEGEDASVPTDIHHVLGLDSSSSRKRAARGDATPIGFIRRSEISCSFALAS
jgi:hypothetical protein